MNRRIALQSLLALGGATGVGTLSRVAHAGEPLVVVVHADVKVDKLSPSELAAIFTTRKRNYEGGQRIIPLNLPPRDPHRVAFDEAVLGMGPDEVARYWIDRRVRGGQAPPKHVPKPALLARLVAKLPGAIGYVPRSDVAEGTRIVTQV